jgi:hypothetical protein
MNEPNKTEIVTYDDTAPEIKEIVAQLPPCEHPEWN